MYQHGAPGMMATAAFDNNVLQQRHQGVVNVQQGFHVVSGHDGHSNLADNSDHAGAHSDDSASMESGDDEGMRAEDEEPVGGETTIDPPAKYSKYE